jgi:hypothetical protein
LKSGKSAAHSHASSRSNYVHFSEGIVFPVTQKECAYSLASFRVNLGSRHLLPDRESNRKLVEGTLRVERRPDRIVILNQLFLAQPNYGIRLKVRFKTLPTRSLDLFNFPLSITSELFQGQDPDWVVKKISEWILHLGARVEKDHVIGYGLVRFPEIDVIRSPHSLAQVYWMEAVAAKVASIIGRLN